MDLFKKVAKVLLVLAGLGLVALILFGIILMLNWPWWTAFFLLAGLIGIVVGVFFIRKLMARKKEQLFVDQIISQDQANLRNLEGNERDRAKEVQQRWKDAIETLKSSHLKKHGNPLYVLPWYLVIGESGTGKTTAINAANLSSPFAESARVSGISGTRNCDWWFFEQAVIIDTAGRYAIPVDASRDQEEWRSFLPFLSKYRKKEPLNGLIVSVSADKLLSAGKDVLTQDGRNIRARIDELMLSLGAKFPIYLLVTKCDLVQGMTNFCDHLPEAAISQALGHLNQDLGMNAHYFLEQALGNIDDHLRNLRLQLLYDADKKASVDPALLLFPDEFARMKDGLNAFMQGAFQENPYQETPLMRGLFFTSGRQEGTPYSHFLKTLGMIGEEEVLPGTNRGLFLHDFFAKILPKDRGIFAPTQRKLAWNKLTRNLGLTSYVAIMIAVCGLMSFSFVKNLHTLRSIPSEFYDPPVLEGQVLTDTVILERFREAILKVEEQNSNWWIPRFGLHESIQVEKQLKEWYCRQFQENLQTGIDLALHGKLSDFSPTTDDRIMSLHVGHLVRRITLLQTGMNERHNLEALSELSPVPYGFLMAGTSSDLLPEVRAKLSTLYFYNILWHGDPEKMNKELIDLKSWLKHALAAKDFELNWLIDWAAWQTDLAPVTIADFWKGSLALQEETHVPAAFTITGKDAIQKFIIDLENDLPDPGPPLIARQKLEFATFFDKEYITAWNVFGKSFSQGKDTLGTQEEWRYLVDLTAQGKGPYIQFLTKMADEIEPLSESDNLPSWVELLYKFLEVKAQSKTVGTGTGNTLLKKAGMKGRQLIDRVNTKVTRGNVRTSDMTGGGLEERFKAAKAYAEMRSYLEAVGEEVSTRSGSYKVAEKFFNDDDFSGDGKFSKAEQSFNKLRAHVIAKEAGEEFLWPLIHGQIDSLVSYAVKETGCYLQKRWERDVLVEIQGLASKREIEKTLLGDGGYAVQFTKKSAAPFLRRSTRKGYFAKTVFDSHVEFNPEILTYLTKGIINRKVVKSSYSVSIKGLPTDVNAGAQVRPHATHVDLQCGDGSQRMVNLNYPVRKTFNWSPDSCGDVVFQIEVGDLILSKTFSGYLPFAQFLSEFKSGQKVYTPKNFPREKAALKRLGISSLKIRYQFGGHKPVISLLSSGPGKVPAKIITCWE